MAGKILVCQNYCFKEKYILSDELVQDFFSLSCVRVSRVTGSPFSNELYLFTPLLLLFTASKLL